MTAVPDAERFHAGRPPRIWERTRSHPLGYIVEALPRGLRALAEDVPVPAGATVLDFGCADMPHRDLFGPDVRWVGADLPGNPDAAVEIRPDGTVPVEDGSVDVVVSTQVLEHVRDPGVYLAECHRVLRPGGRLLLSTHGLMVYHPDPVDLWRWTGEGLRRVVEQAGFRVERFTGIMGLAASGLQFLQDAYIWRLPRFGRTALAFTMQSLIRLVERFERPEDTERNALVFALVAAK